MGHCCSKQHRRKPVRKAQETKKALVQAKPTYQPANYDLSKLAVITVIFNPVGYKSRYDLYHEFAKHMSCSGVFLLTVECIFDSASRFDLPKQNFEITHPNNHRHLQLIAPSIMWMKENLINIAVKRLPENFEYIAWIDADVEFNRLDWPQLTIDALQRYAIVQLFEQSFFLGPSGKLDILRRDYSFGYSIRHNKPIDRCRTQEWYPHPGYAWAMRRTTFNKIGGLFEFSIVGSGDLHLAYALLHRIKETYPVGLHHDYDRLATLWGDRVAQVAQEGASVGYVPVTLWHYWHGKRSDRSYVERWKILERHQFSPSKDLENDATDLLHIIDKDHLQDPTELARINALELDIVNYFRSRDEDNKVKELEPPSSDQLNAIQLKSKNRHDSSEYDHHYRSNDEFYTPLSSNGRFDFCGANNVEDHGSTNSGSFGSFY